MHYPFELVRSRRRTIALQLLPNGKLQVRCPAQMPLDQVQAFVRSKSAWIEKNMRRIHENAPCEPMSPDEIRALSQRAKQVITQRVEHYAAILGVSWK